MKKEKRKISSMKVIKRQLKIIVENKFSFIFLVVLIYSICAGILPVIATYVPKLIIDAFDDSNLNRIYLYVGGLAVASLIPAVLIVICKSIQSSCFLSLRIGEFNRSNHRFMNIDYQHMEDPKFLDSSERNIRTLNNNNEGFEGTYHTLASLCPLIFSLGAYIFIISKFNYLIIIITILGALVAMVVTRLNAKYQYKKKTVLDRAFRHKKYYYETMYDFSYGKDIRINHLDEKLKYKYNMKLVTYLSVIKNIKNRKFLLAFLDLFMLLLQDGLSYYLIISAFYAENPISQGDVSLYIGVTIALSTTLRSIGNIFGKLREYTLYTADYFTYLDSKELSSQRGGMLALSDTLEIEFQDVCFKYPNTEKYIFKHLNFKVNKKEKLAIVGTNGAGKTTLIKLITGLFYPTSGEILINGINAMDFNQEEYRKMFSVVFQDVHIFAASIIENVCGSDISKEHEEKAKLCLEKVGLKEKIESLPNGYNTPLLKIISENGVELSGGQTQKVAIARALYKDGNMVILDEPTAALDALAEADIYQNFDELVQHKTAIYVSHRLSSTKFCDHIALFDEQGLKEYGTHDELIQLKGEYYNMFAIQGKYYQDNKEEIEHEKQ